MTQGIVNIRGKQYQTVAYRVSEFRKRHPDWTINTTIVLHDEGQVLMCTEIRNQDGRLITTGHAHETKKANKINQTSMFENCESSAVGRALAFLGLGGDASIASAEEVLGVIQQQENPPKPEGAKSPQESGGTGQQEQTMEPESKKGSTTDGVIAKIEELVKEANSSNPGKALANLAKTKGAVAWRDLSHQELVALCEKLTNYEIKGRTRFLNSWAGR